MYDMFLHWRVILDTQLWLYYYCTIQLPTLSHTTTIELLRLQLPRSLFQTLHTAGMSHHKHP